MKNLFKLFLLLAFFVFSNPSVYGQGNTTSSINGVVYDDDKNPQPLPGATILAVHTPSGTRYSTATDFAGNYRISNMRVGGPY